MEMDQREQLEMIKMIIAEEMDLNAADITEEMSLDQDLDMDQNSIMQVLAACEVEFDVTYEQEDYEDIKTVGDILRSLGEWE